MKLNYTQRNFRKKMKELENEGYKFEHDIYSPTRRKKAMTSSISVISIIGLLVLIWNFTALIKWTNYELTSFKQRGIPAYMNKIKELDTETQFMLNDLINNIPKNRSSSEKYLANIVKYENEFKENRDKLLQLKSPKKLHEYHYLKLERYENILYLLYELKVGAQTNSYSSSQINNLIEKINIIGGLERESLINTFEVAEINYEIRDKEIYFETKSMY